MKDTITKKTYNGFYTFSTQKILYNFTGGATIIYTQSFAVANAAGRPVDKAADKAVAANDGIIFGDKLSLEKVSIEVNWDLFNENKDTMTSLIPIDFYYRLYDVVKDPECKNGMDYNLNTHQKIINPLNVLFEDQLGVTDELVNSGLGTIINAFNNIAFSSWIGQDYTDDVNAFDSFVTMIYRSIKDSITKNIKF